MNDHLSKLIFILLCSFLMACVNQKNEKKQEEKIFPITYKIDLIEKESPLVSDIFKEVAYIPLETSDSVLLPGINDIKRVRMHKDCFYIADYKKITIFNSEGKWLRTIDHKGDSP